MFPVARSSFDSVAIRYVLPVLWMTSCFTQCASCVRIPKRREHNRLNYCNQVLINDKEQQFVIGVNVHFLYFGWLPVAVLALHLSGSGAWERFRQNVQMYSV